MLTSWFLTPSGQRKLAQQHCSGKKAPNSNPTAAEIAGFGIFPPQGWYTSSNDMSNDQKLTLNEYQLLIQKLVLERGFDKETVPEVFTLLVEEVGELAKAIRKANGQKVDKASRHHDVAEEAADVFWLLIDLCNRLDIDLAKAFQEKETKNQKRTWQ